jgi:hypothetical protein
VALRREFPRGSSGLRGLDLFYIPLFVHMRWLVLAGFDR